MSYDYRRDVNAGHEEFAALIPWYVNGRIGEADRRRLDAHLPTCAACRDDLLLERHVHASIASDVSVEYMPAASLKRLQARLGAPDVDTSRTGTTPPPPPVRRSVPWQGRMAASIAVLTVALGLLGIDEWTQIRARGTSADYYTVTTPTARAPDTVIRAVFSSTITLVELQAILGEAQLRIVTGPTEAGVYSLASNSSRPASVSLSVLRQHAAVRFAEITQPNLKASVSP